VKLGLLGPANGDVALLREAAEFLLGDVEVEQAVYLGQDDALDRVVRAWASEIVDGAPGEAAFLARAADLMKSGRPEEIEQLLEHDDRVRHLTSLRKVPPSPARAIEMLADRIVTLVYDKAVLSEEDIANASLLVYGKSKDVLLKRFGPRYFFTPGPLKSGKVGVVEADDDGQVTVGVFAPSGLPIWSESLQGRTTGKISVSG
jgi:hypothetical protein